MNVIFACYVLSVFGLSSVSSDDIQCTVSTKYGSLAGKEMTTRDGKSFCAFLAVPYAAAPIGQLRFAPPLPPSPWKDARDATKESEMCIQKSFLGLFGSEDCLYLNVFTHLDHKTGGRSYPVMVYIHGGGFFMGSPSLGFTGPEYFMDKNIVLVALQYRLGPFGFLSTGDEVIPGNMGLKDQVKALEWVRENIDSFGGDPNKVTLFGNSAGASSVHLHMLSPRSQNLFARGISQSGTAFSGFGFMNQQLCRTTTENMAKTLNCPNTSSNGHIIECMKNKNSTDLLAAYDTELNKRYLVNRMLFRPVVEPETDHAFITKDLTNYRLYKPWIVGVNANEASFLLSEPILNQTTSLVNLDMENFAPSLLLFDYKWKVTAESANQIKKFYLKDTSAKNITIQSLERLITDAWFVWPMLEAIKYHGGILYCYLYNHRSEHSYVEFYDAPKGFGVSHVDELIMLFKQSAIFPELNSQDANVSKVMVEMWVNFATVGNPTPKPIGFNPQSNSSGDFKWNKFSPMPNYIHIETDKLSMMKRIFHERVQFWRGLLASETAASSNLDLGTWKSLIFQIIVLYSLNSFHIA